MIFLNLTKHIKSAVKQCFSIVKQCVVYSTNEILSTTNKDVLSASQNSNVIRAFLRLQDRIKQRVPKTICFCSSSQKCLVSDCWCKSSNYTNTQSLASDSAIGLHLLQNPVCAQHYDDSRLSVFAQGSSPFHVSALETTFIKSSYPAHC